MSDSIERMRVLAAALAHQLNNPLAAISANLDLAVRDLDPSSLLAEGLRDAQESARNMRRAIDDLRLFSRAFDGTIGPVDVHRVLESTLRIAWHEIGRRARVGTKLSGAALVESNEGGLAHAFLDALLLVAPVMRDEVHVTTASIGDRVTVEIVCPNPVSSPRAESIEACRGMFEQLGASLQLEGDARGLVLRVALAAERAPVKVRRGKILVVDDEPMIGNVVRRALAREHDVTSLRNGNDALARIQEGERFDVILCDLMMPEMTGMDFHAHLQTVAPELASRVIFLTADAFSTNARAFLDAMPNQHMEKPFDTLHLSAVINDRIR
jgi:CheY-like chemotaxis protein